MTQSVDRLKELLFDSESRTLADLRSELEAVGARDASQHAALTQRLEQLLAAEAIERAVLNERIDKIFERTGTEQRFRESVAAVIDGALRDAEVSKHHQMARAIAPLVVRTIKTELRNSQDEMVEALYPIMGRLVKAYVTSAVKDMTDQINRRIEGNALMLRLRSLTSGRSVAELAMADGQRLEVEELFLIRRGSGELVQRWPQSTGSEASDIHLSGVLTAINEFAGHSFKADGGNLRSFEIDELTVFLRASPAYLLAAKCRGNAPHNVETVLDEEFLRAIERNKDVLSGKTVEAGPIDAQAAGMDRLLAPLAASLGTRLAERQAELASPARTITPVRLLLAMILLPMLGWFGWRAYSDYVTEQAREAAQRVVDGTPELLGYPTTLAVGANGRVITIGGRAPSREVKEEVVARLRREFASGSVVDHVNVVAGAVNEAVPQIARVRRDLAGLESEVARSTVRRQVNLAVSRLESVQTDLAKLEEGGATAAQRKAANETKAVIGQALKETGDIGRTLAVTSSESASLSAMIEPLHDLARRVRASAGVLGAVLSGAQTEPAIATEPAPTDVLASAERLSAASERLQTVAAAVAQAAQIKPPPPAPPPTPRERLDAWTRANAIFFGNGTEYRSTAASENKLDELARLVIAANATVRIIGYTDDAGGQARNVPLAVSRAEKVAAALAERGVARNRLIPVGRGISQDLTPAVGPSSANRRVELQVAFEGETDETP